MSPSRRKKPDPFKMPRPPKPPAGFKRFPKMKPFPGTKWKPPTGPAAPETLDAIQEAIDGRQLISATYVDEEGDTDDHAFFPLELGAKGREPRVWAYQTGGGSGVGWRCFVVGRLSNVTTQQAEWTVPENTAASARCMDQERTPAR